MRPEDVEFVPTIVDALEQIHLLLIGQPANTEALGLIKDYLDTALINKQGIDILFPVAIFKEWGCGQTIEEKVVACAELAESIKEIEAAIEGADQDDNFRRKVEKVRSFMETMARRALEMLVLTHHMIEVRENKKGIAP